jgi:hypothetical protein
MKVLTLTVIILTFMIINFGQDLKTLIADGTAQIPKKNDLEPTIETLKKEEIEAVKKAALEKEVEFSALPQMSSEESIFKKDFELLDVAEGYFIYREIQFRAYLYTAYSQKMKRNYQGILVLSISNNGAKFTPKAHYVYEYRGDKFIRTLSDINGNVLSELAIFSQPPTKRFTRKLVRIIEFSPNGIEKLGSMEFYLSIPQRQRTPWSPAGSPPDKKVYILPIVNAVKLFAVKNIGKPPTFWAEKWKRNNDIWRQMDNISLRHTELEEDNVNYIEQIKPIFPTGIGEK